MVLSYSWNLLKFNACEKDDLYLSAEGKLHGHYEHMTAIIMMLHS